MKIPLDIIVYRLVRAYLRATSMRRAALKVGGLDLIPSFYIPALVREFTYLLRVG